MPYINQKIRGELDVLIKPLVDICRHLMWGELNYVLTKILLGCRPETYADYNGLVGVLECVKLELYRRMVAPFEDSKKKENGEVY